MYDELIKRLRECTAEQNGEKTLWHQAADAIEELTEERDMYIKAMADEHNRAARLAWEHRWIPVTEKLPDKYVSVWTYSKFGMLQDEYIGEYDGENYFARQTTHVTHWQPLPEPPKEETE